MKKVFFLFFLMPLFASGQIVDDFESGNIDKWICPVSGHWTAESSTAISGNYLLHHSFDNSTAGYDQAGLSLEDLKPLSGTTTWAFKVRHGYAPSSSNNWTIFLMSDQEPSAMMPGSGVNGFAVGVNLSGYDDTLRLWKIKNGSVTKVLSSGLNWERDIGIGIYASISVERSAAGDWKMVVTKGSAQTGWVRQIKDHEIFLPKWFGIYYKYTATADRLLWVDDVKIDGVFFTDSIPPHPDTAYITAKNKLIITFDEEPDITLIDPLNYKLNNEEAVVESINKISNQSVEITFQKDFINKEVNLIIIRNICDSISNCASDITISVKPIWSETTDVIISEIMADPVPSFGLPEKEYLELTNRSDFDFNMKGWTLTSGSSVAVFPDKVITTGESVILCALSDTSSFKSYGRVIGLKSFPLLSDQGKLLIMSNEYNDLIHGIDYSSDWYGDILKSAGGWSLEIIDTGFPFYFEGNWTASESGTGGTPGSPNSVSGVNHDKVRPLVLNVFPSDSASVIVNFSEPVFIAENMAAGITIDDANILSIKPTDPLFRSYSIIPAGNLIKNEIVEVSFPELVTDFSGNLLNGRDHIFGVPEPADIGDLTFNEILFNPYSEAVDFIEFYNCSDKIIDAASLMLISVSDITQDTSDYVVLSDDHRCIMPNSYFVVTTNKSTLANIYISIFSNAVFEVSNLPSMPDEEGHLILINKNLHIVDEVLYDEEMHFELLSGYEGVSLEKIRLCSSSSIKENWHSASESSGWGTPGLPNSVLSYRSLTEDLVSFSSTKITPDNNGFEDFLLIDLRFEEEGNVISVTVFDEMGYFIIDLANNLSVGTDETLKWDGTDSFGSIVGTGIYVIYFSGFDEKGKVTKWKRVCTVLRR